MYQASTSEIFGNYAFKSDEESNAVSGNAGEARWSYAVSKLAAEHLTAAYFHQYKLPTVSVRPFNIYGNGQNKVFLFPTIINQLLESKKDIIEVDNLKPKRDYYFRFNCSKWCVTCY